MEQYVSKSAVVAEIDSWRDGVKKGIFSIPLTGSDRARWIKMKAKITVEQFDNGISLKWESGETPDMQAVVALEYDKEKALGKMILEDVDSIMNRETCNKVEMEIDYNPVKE